MSRCELTLERLTIDSIFRSSDFAFRAQETDFGTSFCISGVSESFRTDLPDNLSYGHLLLSAGMAGADGSAGLAGPAGLAAAADGGGGAVRIIALVVAIAYGLIFLSLVGHT